MRLLRLAIEEERWDLAAHTLVLAAARVVKPARRRHKNAGEKEDATGTGKKESNEAKNKT